MRRRAAVLGFVSLCLFAGPAEAIITGVRGNKPTTDRNWPQGTLSLANLKIRLGWWEGPPLGGGQFHFLYRGDTAKFADALKRFSEIQAPQRVLVIREGEHHSFWLKDEKDPKASRVDWEFTVCTPASWYQLYNDPRRHFLTNRPNYRRPLAPPKLEVYLSGTIDWSKIEVPSNITVVDRRLSSVGLRADEGGAVRGVVYDMMTSKPIPEAKLTLAPRSKELKPLVLACNARGEFDARKVPAGVWGLSVSADGYAARSIGYEEIKRETLLVYDDVRLVRTGSVTGKVTDTEGQPFAGARIRVSDCIAADGHGYGLAQSPEATSQADGSFVIEEVPLGFCRLRCGLRGYYYDSPFTLHTVPTENLHFRMTQTGMLRVRVLATNGEPVKGNHIVELEAKDGGNWGGSANVNEQGERVFKGVPPGRYEVWAHPNPHSSRFPAPRKTIEIGGKRAVAVELQYTQDQ